MENLIFTPEQMDKARRFLRGDDDSQLGEELQTELGEEQVCLLFEAVENEPLARSDAWTVEHISQARRIRELRPLTAPGETGAKEAAKELAKLMSEVNASLGDSWEIEKWCEQQEPRRSQLQAQLGEELAGFYLLLAGKERTVWDLRAASKLSQPTVWRRLKTLEQRGLIQELPPLPARWAVVESE